MLFFDMVVIGLVGSGGRGGDGGCGQGVKREEGGINRRGIRKRRRRRRI